MGGLCPKFGREELAAGSIGTSMKDVARLLEQIETGDACAAGDLLPIVYEQLRRLAHRQLAHEPPGQSFQTADLIHEAYLRLAGSDRPWKSRRHFLGAAAEAMRRILVERARKKRRIKHGGRIARVELRDAAVSLGPSPDEVVAVSDLLESLAREHPLEAQVVKLHYFAGLSIREAGEALGVSKSATHRHWTFARAWLRAAIQSGDQTG